MLDKIPAWERRAAKNAKVVEELKAKRAKAVKPKRVRSPLEYIYFVRSEEFVKIGWATNLETRMNTLQVDNPHLVELLAIMVGGQKEEAFLHAHFRSHHHRGEWFRLSPEIHTLVDEIMLLDPIFARVRAGEWFIRKAGLYNLKLFDRNIEAMRKREGDVANVVHSVTVALPSVEKTL